MNNVETTTTLFVIGEIYFVYCSMTLQFFFCFTPQFFLFNILNFKKQNPRFWLVAVDANMDRILSFPP